MNDLSDFTSQDLLDHDADQLFITRRARELAAQMDTWNKPGDPYPTHVEIQQWAGAAAGILKMVAGDAWIEQHDEGTSYCTSIEGGCPLHD